MGEKKLALTRETLLLQARKAAVKDKTKRKWSEGEKEVGREKYVDQNMVG